MQSLLGPRGFNIGQKIRRLIKRFLFICFYFKLDILSKLLSLWARENEGLFIGQFLPPEDVD